MSAAVPNVVANGIDLYYERRGAGPRLLFLNGSGSSIETSELLIKLFTNDFEVLVHDQRGLGRTEVPPGPYTMADYAADAAALLDHVGLGSGSRRRRELRRDGRAGARRHVAGADRAPRAAVHVAGRCGRCVVPAARARGALGSRAGCLARRSLLDTRFTPEWLAEHPGDRGLADMMASRRGGQKTPDAAARRSRAARRA